MKYVQFKDIRIIRLTNAGEFVDRCELTEVLDDILCNHPDERIDFKYAKYSPIEGCTKAEIKKPKLTVLFVHGWMHNAERGDSNLEDFQGLINEIKQQNTGKSVLGVYIGWNAAGPLPGALAYLTFWSKKALADRIAQAGAMTLITSAIGALSNSQSHHGSQFIAIGHSFGARLLYSATSQSIIYQTQRAYPKPPLSRSEKDRKREYGFVKAATDTVILLNPAFEATIFSAINGVTRGSVSSSYPDGSEETFRVDQPPLIVTISSTADSATGFFFPKGQWLDMKRSSLEQVTLGNEKTYWTHELKRSSASECDAGHAPTNDAVFLNGICLKRLIRSPVQPSQLHNPFIVATTDETIIPDHSKIWEPAFKAWLGTFVTKVGQAHDAAVEVTP